MKRAIVAVGQQDVALDSVEPVDPDVEVIGKACPLLVPLVEEGWIHDDVTRTVLARYLDGLLREKIDTLILGCTHYPLLRSAFRKLLGDSVRLINPAYETALSLSALLAEKDLLAADSSTNTGHNICRFFVSDEAERFSDFARSILPIDVASATLVPIENY